MIEKQIENKLTMAVKKNGGIALKLVCPSFAGIDERIVKALSKKEMTQTALIDAVKADLEVV